MSGCSGGGDVPSPPTTFSITTTSLPSGQVSTPYSTTLAASGGTPPYQWSVSGALPPGLTLAAATGVISGTPTAVENGGAVTIQVADSETPHRSSSQSLSVTISPAMLHVATTSLPSGQVSIPYSTTLTASGGTPPYQWSLSNGALPAGLTLAAATGVISGTPETVENAEAITVQVTDSATPRQSSSQSLSVTISPATLHVATTSLPSGQIGIPYSSTLTASGGTPPYQWSVSRALPPGLTLAAATGVISGTPTTVENAEAITVQVADSETPHRSSSQSLSVTISPATLHVATTSLPPGQVGNPYSATLAAFSGMPPYHWSVSSGALPAGLVLATSTGVISGTPTTAENAEAVTVQVTDSATPRQSSSQSLSLTINPSTLRVTTTSLASGQVGTPYSTTLTGSGGTPPYHWSVSSGALPPGLTLAAATGVISGTPTTVENGEVVAIQVADSGTPHQTSSQSLSVTISASTLRVTTTSLPPGQVGAPYNATLAAAGGTPPYHWSVSSGALPAGLVLATSTGVISGTPTTVENAEAVTFQVTDSAATPHQSSSQSLSLTINPSTLRVTTTSLPSGQVSTPYNATLAASGGTPPYQWSVSSGALPAGLTLAAATGIISGTPTTVENAEVVTLQVVDSGTPHQSNSQSLSVTINPSTLRVTTTSLPPGQVSTPYNATLAAAGGTPPYQWSVSSGALPAGLTLAAATGVISGSPAAAANATKLTFKVTDSGSPAQIGYAPLTLTVSSGNIAISISPKSAALTVTQIATLAATTNDPAGVRWSVSPSGGSLSSTQSLSGMPIKFTAPSAAGVYSLIATSVTDPTESASARVAVTDLPGVFTYHNDLARDGVNGQEYALTPSTLAAGFGKIFSCTVDGAVHSQPLWVANLRVGGAKRNVVFVATAHDSLFAFDADASPCVKLWQVSLLDEAHGTTTGETTVPSGPAPGNLVGKGFGNITPEVGVIGTPVIDSASGTLYVVSKSIATVSGAAKFYQRLHAIDITTGLEKASSPVVIQATYPGSGDGTSMVTWNAGLQNQRAGLVLANGTVYIAWGSHEDKSPYYGWVIGYRYGTSGFTQTAALNVTPNVQDGGIWMSGAAPAADSSGNLYLITGNGGFDVTNTSPPNNDYGDSFLELSINASPASPQTGFSIPQWFTPSDQQTDQTNDRDFGAGGAAVLADVVAGNPPVTTHLVVGGGKDGSLYLLDRDRMGGYGDVNAWEKISTGNSLYSTVAFWNDTIYVVPAGGPLTSYALSAASMPVEFKREYRALSPTGGFGWPGATPAISARGSANAIVWALDTNLYCTPQAAGCGPAVLHAYDPANQLSEIWNSSLAESGADAAGNAIQYTVPTIANGKVYVGTRGNNTGGATTSTTVPGELDVYGLKSN
jgi:Putative Ig domain